MLVKSKRKIATMGVVVALGLIALFAYRHQVSNTKTEAAERGSPPILVPTLGSPRSVRAATSKSETASPTI